MTRQHVRMGPLMQRDAATDRSRMSLHDRVERAGDGLSSIKPSHEVMPVSRSD
jgi:hypothetical protein